MADHFNEPLRHIVSYPSGWISYYFFQLLHEPQRFMITLIVTVLVVGIATRLLSGSDSKPETVNGKPGRTIWLLPHWVPFIGHGLQL